MTICDVQLTADDEEARGRITAMNGGRGIKEQVVAFPWRKSSDRDDEPRVIGPSAFASETRTRAVR